MGERTAIVPTGDFPSDRTNTIDDLAHLIHSDQDNFDRGMSWSDAWSAARVAFDAGWRPSQNGRTEADRG